jgi:hypothetical protein
MHEWQDGNTSRMVEEHHVVHPVVLMIFPCLVPVLIEPRSRLTHQQASIWYYNFVRHINLPCYNGMFSQ